jgi:predicted HAD superfamily Cof-like phosphohydrolase
VSQDEVWTRINNALAHTAELLADAAVRQTQIDKEMVELRKLSKASDERLDRHIEFVTEAIAKTAAAQEVTEQRLQVLINKVDTVDDRVTTLEKKKP